MKIRYKIKDYGSSLYLGRPVVITNTEYQLWNSHAGGSFPFSKKIKYPVSGYVSAIQEYPDGGNNDYVINVKTDYGELGYCLQTLIDNNYTLTDEN